MGLFSKASSYLGIDIGSTSIKIVELKKDNNQMKLVSYGFTETLKSENKWQGNIDNTAQIINKICDEAGIMGKNAISALPTFSVFSSVINLTNVTRKDIADAVQWEAKKVIPLPLDEMILDWKLITTNQADSKDKKSKKNTLILLTGAPRPLVKKYIDIFKAGQFNLLSLETETFSLIRSLLGNDKSTIMLVEIGAGTTDVSIVDNSIPVLNRSIDVGGISITKAISKNLNIGFERAEQFKHDLGLSSLEEKSGEAPKTIVEQLSPIVNEIKYALNLYQGKANKRAEKIIISGGGALLPDLSNYFSKLLDVNVVIGDPWARISYPLDLKPLLNEIGPRMSVAIGLAMREIE